MLKGHCHKCRTHPACLRDGKCFIDTISEILNEDMMNDDDNVAETSELRDMSDTTEESDFFVKQGE